jgi:hypothetical protein
MSMEFDASLLQYLETIDTPTISNAIERLEVRPNTSGFAPVEIKCLSPGLGRMCGHAVTAQVETITESYQKTEEVFISLFEFVEQSAKPAVVVFQELGHHPEYAAHCGEVMARFSSGLAPSGWSATVPFAIFLRCETCNFTSSLEGRWPVTRISGPADIAYDGGGLQAWKRERARGDDYSWGNGYHNGRSVGHPRRSYID